MNESLFYPDGYKLTLTDSADEIVAYQEHKDVKNYVALELSALESIADGETIRVNLTPVNVEGTITGTETANGYSLDWSVQDVGETAECTFQIDFAASSSPDAPASEANRSDYLVYLYDSEGNEVAKVGKDKTITTSCYQMTGGSVQIAEKRWPKKDKTMVSFAVPFVNGASVQITASQVADADGEMSPISQKLTEFLSKVSFASLF